MLCFVMPTVARTNRWIILFGIRFQPSELAKISLVLFLAYFLEPKKHRLNEWRLVRRRHHGAGPLLILKEPDFGTALLIFAIGGLMLFLGGVKFRYLAALGAVAVAVFAVYLFSATTGSKGSQLSCLPDKDILGNGFQVSIQARRGLGRPPRGQPRPEHTKAVLSALRPH